MFSRKLLATRRHAPPRSGAPESAGRSAEARTHGRGASAHVAGRAVMTGPLPPRPGLDFRGGRFIAPARGPGICPAITGAPPAAPPTLIADIRREAEIRAERSLAPAAGWIDVLESN